MSLIKGLHHITAVAAGPQRNLDFYSGLLGLWLVKKTVNQDDPLTYHLYYADALGRPGTAMTFSHSRACRPGSRAEGSRWRRGLPCQRNLCRTGRRRAWPPEWPFSGLPG